MPPHYQLKGRLVPLVTEALKELNIGHTCSGAPGKGAAEVIQKGSEWLARHGLAPHRGRCVFIIHYNRGRWWLCAFLCGDKFPRRARFDFHLFLSEDPVMSLELNRWLAVVMLVGCTAWPTESFPGSLQQASLPAALDRESDAREPIFRDLLRMHKGDEPCFLSFGTKDGKDIDPPDDYLKCFKDLKLVIKKASDSVYKGLTIQDRLTAKAGALYRVSLSKKISDNELILDASCDRGFLNSHGYKVRLVKEGKRWIPKEVLGSWVS
jgi:hypothetical protein